MVLIGLVANVLVFISNQWFPSPCGDYGSYLTVLFPRCKTISICFRPLAGIMVLINTSISAKAIAAIRRFRPLAGIMVLIGLAHRIESSVDMLEFPSPCGDYGSYHHSTPS